LTPGPASSGAVAEDHKAPELALLELRPLPKRRRGQTPNVRVEELMAWSLDHQNAFLAGHAEAHSRTAETNDKRAVWGPWKETVAAREPELRAAHAEIAYLVAQATRDEHAQSQMRVAMAGANGVYQGVVDAARLLDRSPTSTLSVCAYGLRASRARLRSRAVRVRRSAGSSRTGTRSRPRRSDDGPEPAVAGAVGRVGAP
jgi:hypothetical protein